MSREYIKTCRQGSAGHGKFRGYRQKVAIGYRMLAQPNRMFERVPIIFGPRDSRPMGITQRCSSTILSFVRPMACLSLRRLGLCHAWHVRSSNGQWPKGDGKGEINIGSDYREADII